MKKAKPVEAAKGENRAIEYLAMFLARMHLRKLDEDEKELNQKASLTPRVPRE